MAIITMSTVIAWLGPSPKLKPEGKWFGPKQNTKFPFYHHPPPPPPSANFSEYSRIQIQYFCNDFYIVSC